MAQQGTKSQMALEILEKIGALSKNPPTGWLQQVAEALDRKNVSMHPQSIYGVRAKALKEKLASQRSERMAERRAQREEEEQQTTEQNGLVSLTVADLLVVKEFIHEFGGMERLKSALQAFDTLTAEKE